MKNRVLIVSAIVLVCVLLSIVLMRMTTAAPQNPPVNVEVANTPLPVDISGWLHTTMDDQVVLEIAAWDNGEVEIETRGYRTLTLMFDANDTCGLAVSTVVHDCFSYGEDRFSYDPFEHGRWVQTYEIHGYNMTILVNAAYWEGNTYNHPVRAQVWWYLTT